MLIFAPAYSTMNCRIPIAASSGGCRHKSMAASSGAAAEYDHEFTNSARGGKMTAPQGSATVHQTANAGPAGAVVVWHAVSADEVLERLASDAVRGLDPAEAAARLQKYGPNRLPEGKRR